MTTVQQIIEGAYSRSTANDPGKLATDGELLALANRIYHALWAIAAAAAPERYVSRVATAALAGAPASTALSVDVIDVRRVETALGGTVNVIPVEEKTRSWHLAPAIYRQGSVLVSRGALAGVYGAAADPVGGDILTVWQLDAPTDLTALAQVLDARFPTRHMELIITMIAMYLSTKDEGRDAAEYQKLKSYHDSNMEMFLRLSGLSMTALQSPHGGVIVQRLNALMGVKE